MRAGVSLMFPNPGTGDLHIGSSHVPAIRPCQDPKLPRFLFQVAGNLSLVATRLGKPNQIDRFPCLDSLTAGS